MFRPPTTSPRPEPSHCSPPVSLHEGAPMLSKLKKSCLVLLLAAASACGGATEVQPLSPREVGESAQAVLYPPPAPASGNILDSTAYLGPVSLPGAVQT